MFLILLIIVALGIPLVFNISYLLEGFSNYKLDLANGPYPKAQTEVLVQDTYPAIGKNQISNNTSADIWQEYPVFQLGSYEQKTNNIRYPDSPDEGTCMPASMCGALYKDKKIGNNDVPILQPICPDAGTRVGYFTTVDPIITSLPYKTDLANILY